MAIRIAGYRPDTLFGRRDKVLGFERRLQANDFQRIEGKNVVVQSVDAILSTPRTKRVRDPSFGTELYKYIFEPADAITAEAIRREVIASLEEQDERIRIQSVDIQMFTDSKGFAVTVKFTLPPDKAYQTTVEFTPETFEILEEEE